MDKTNTKLFKKPELTARPLGVPSLADGYGKPAGAVPAVGREVPEMFWPVLMLSEREHEIFLAAGDGVSTGELAEKFHLSTKTIEAHYAHIKLKTGLTNLCRLRVLATRYLDFVRGTGLKRVDVKFDAPYRFEMPVAGVGR